MVAGPNVKDFILDDSISKENELYAFLSTQEEIEDS